MLVQSSASSPDSSPANLPVVFSLHWVFQQHPHGCVALGKLSCSEHLVFAQAEPLPRTSFHSLPNPLLPGAEE